jgi:hypothetical protein
MRIKNIGRENIKNIWRVKYKKTWRKYIVIPYQ